MPGERRIPGKVAARKAEAPSDVVLRKGCTQRVCTSYYSAFYQIDSYAPHQKQNVLRQNQARFPTATRADAMKQPRTVRFDQTLPRRIDCPDRQRTHCADSLATK